MAEMNVGHHRDIPRAATMKCGAADGAAGTMSVLLIDDDEVFRHGLADNLREDGHAVLEYPAPCEVPALSTLAEVSVVVTDYEMPGSDGLGFADRVHTARPSLPVVILTANRQGPLVTDAATRSFVHLVYKPVDYQQLHQLLHTLSAGAPSD
jgi:DNA-binding NtrC family response regulator